MAYDLVLHGNVPSKKNSLRRIMRGGRIFTVASEAHEAWHAEQIMMARAQWRGKQPLHAARAILTFYPKTHHRSDATNKAESVMDLLVHAGILPDDNWFVVPEITLRLGGVDSDNPRVEIVLEAL